MIDIIVREKVNAYMIMDVYEGYGVLGKNKKMIFIYRCYFVFLSIDVDL